MRSIKEQRHQFATFATTYVMADKTKENMELQTEILLDIKELLIEIETQMPFEPNGPR